VVSDSFNSHRANWVDLFFRDSASPCGSRNSGSRHRMTTERGYPLDQAINPQGRWWDRESGWAHNRTKRKAMILESFGNSKNIELYSWGISSATARHWLQIWASRSGAVRGLGRTRPSSRREGRKILERSSNGRSWLDRHSARTQICRSADWSRV
jgi:hypothetical protein